MTDREKMIEEIARLICENEKPCCACLKCTIYDGKICCKYLRIAKKIVNLLIPNGALVLTKAEYDDMRNLTDCAVCEIESNKRKDSQIEQVQKETEGEFATNFEMWNTVYKTALMVMRGQW